MKTVYKYKWADEVELPQKAKILRADFQNDELFFWAFVNPEAPKEKRKLLLLPTGNVGIGDEQGLIYINTVFQGPYVWHLFEILEGYGGVMLR